MRTRLVHGGLVVAGVLALAFALFAPQVVTAQPATVAVATATRAASAVVGSAVSATATRAPAVATGVGGGAVIAPTATRPATVATAVAVIPATGNPAGSGPNTGLVVALAIAGILGAVGLAARFRPQGRRLL